jgi:hypothetical protein
MMKPRFALPLACALALSAAACSSDVADDASAGHAQVATFDDAPIGIVAAGDRLIALLPSELLAFAPDGTSTRLTDRRYRECPWNPAQKWDDVVDPLGGVLPDGRAIVFNRSICGAWAFSLDGGSPDELVRYESYRHDRGGEGYLWGGEPGPAFDAVRGLLVTPDTEGLLACVRAQYEGHALWALEPDGSPREKLADLPGYDCDAVVADAAAVFVSTHRRLLRFDRATRDLTTLFELEEYGKMQVAETERWLYVLSSRGLAQISKHGGAIMQVTASDGWSTSLAFTLDERFVYWATQDELVRAPHEALEHVELLLSGGEQLRIATESNRALAVAGDHLWVITYAGPTARERRPGLSRVALHAER